MMHYYDILSAFHNQHVRNSSAQLWGRNLKSGFKRSISILGTPPLAFSSAGQALQDYRLYGSAAGAGIYNSQTENYNIPVIITDGTDSVSVSVNIGTDPLYADEYVSFSEQKIYRKINNILTPVSAELPVISTFSGNNLIQTSSSVAVVYLQGEIQSLATHILTDSTGKTVFSSDGYQLTTKEQNS